MLPTNRSVRIPDAVETRMEPQVINVPVRPLRPRPMVRHAGSHASRAQCTADINVETASQPKYAESPNLDQLIPGTKED
jgi:hypothetical protein